MFCKVCGAWIPSADAQCDECGAIGSDVGNVSHDDIPDAIKTPFTENSFVEDIMKTDNQADELNKMSDTINLDEDLTSLDDSIFNEAFDKYSKYSDSESSEMPDLRATDLDNPPGADKYSFDTDDALSRIDEIGEVFNKASENNIDDILNFNNTSNSDNVVSNEPANLQEVERKSIQNNDALNNSNSDVSIANNKKKPPVLLFLIIAVAVIGTLVANSKLHFLPFNNAEKETTHNVITTSTHADNTTTSTTTATTTSADDGFVDITLEPSSTTATIADTYTAASVEFVSEKAAKQATEGLSNAYDCGQVKNMTIANNIRITLTTDKYEVIFSTLKDGQRLSSDNFRGRSVIVVGNKLYDTISATKVYVYDAVPTTTQKPTTTTTTARHIPETTKPAVTQSSRPLTTRTTTTKPTIVNVQIKYISADNANALKQSWIADRTKLGSSNAYYGTIKNASVKGNQICVSTGSRDIYFYTNENINTSQLVGQNILAVAKVQNGKIIANNVYIYK